MRKIGNILPFRAIGNSVCQKPRVLPKPSVLPIVLTLCIGDQNPFSIHIRTYNNYRMSHFLASLPCDAMDTPANENALF